MLEKELVDEELEKADQAYQDARILFENEGSKSSAASLLYYSCYHAARALLFQRGYDPKTHAGVVSLYGQHLVDGENITRDDAKFLSKSQSRREKAEYEYEDIEENIEKLADETEDFLEKMKGIVEENR